MGVFLYRLLPSALEPSRHFVMHFPHSQELPTAHSALGRPFIQAIASFCELSC
jgi:hypothetical protein